MRFAFFLMTIHCFGIDLAGKSPEERVRVSMVVDYVNEIVFKAYRLNFENDETKKVSY